MNADMLDRWIKYVEDAEAEVASLEEENGRPVRVSCPTLKTLREELRQAWLDAIRAEARAAGAPTADVAAPDSALVRRAS